jgi:tyrosine-protein phosphatase YwqE
MVAKKEILPLAGKYVLVEMSYAVESPNIRDTIFQLQTKGWRPILAHPERYPYYHRRMSNYEDLLDAGAEFQINLLSLTGYYGKPIQKMAEKLIELQWVNWVGTDLHHERHLQGLFGLCQQKSAMNYLHKIKHLKNDSLLTS